MPPREHLACQFVLWLTLRQIVLHTESIGAVDVELRAGVEVQVAIKIATLKRILTRRSTSHGPRPSRLLIVSVIRVDNICLFAVLSNIEVVRTVSVDRVCSTCAVSLASRDMGSSHEGVASGVGLLGVQATAHEAVAHHVVVLSDVVGDQHLRGTTG